MHCEWTKLCTNIWYHEQNEVVHQLDVNQKKENTFQLSSQYILSRTYQDFNKFRQEDMIRMTKVPTTPTPSTTKPFPIHTSREQDKTSLPIPIC